MSYGGLLTGSSSGDSIASSTSLTSCQLCSSRASPTANTLDGVHPIGHNASLDRLKQGWQGPAPSKPNVHPCRYRPCLEEKSKHSLYISQAFQQQV